MLSRQQPSTSWPVLLPSRPPPKPPRLAPPRSRRECINKEEEYSKFSYWTVARAAQRGGQRSAADVVSAPLQRVLMQQFVSRGFGCEAADARVRGDGHQSVASVHLDAAGLLPQRVFIISCTRVHAAELRVVRWRRSSTTMTTLSTLCSLARRCGASRCGGEGRSERGCEEARRGRAKARARFTHLRCKHGTRAAYVRAR